MHTPNKPIEVFSSFNLPLNRKITDSKALYLDDNPLNMVIFNANIFLKNKSQFIKIWNGDVDVSLDGEKLKAIANELETTLFISKELEEVDLIEEVEVNNNPSNLFVWNTELKTPYLTNSTKKEILNIKRIEKEKIIKEISNRIEKDIEISNTLPLINPDSLFNKKIIKKIPINDGYIQDYLQKELSNPSDYPFYKNDLFSNKFFDHVLISKFGIENLSKLKISSMWISEEFNDTMNGYNKMFDEKLMSKNVSEQLYSGGFNYCSYLSTLQYSNSNALGFNNKSFKNYTIYILEDFLQ